MASLFFTIYIYYIYSYIHHKQKLGNGMVTVSPVDPELARVGSAAGSTLAKGLKLYFEIEGENAGIWVLWVD